jgi:4-azaleucine resistance transporter AzlC
MPRKEKITSSSTLAAAWPVCLGYTAIGLAFGVLAQKAGFSPWQIGLMSLVVYAGSAQFIAVSLLSQGAAALVVIGTTFIVNLRHLLMSAALAVHLRPLPRKWLPLFAYGVTDESFAVNMNRFVEGTWDWRRALAVNHLTNLTWILATIAGGLGGQYLPAHILGIDFALTAMFVGLLVMQLSGRKEILVAVLAGVVACLVYYVSGGYYHVFIAPVLTVPLVLSLAVWVRRLKGNK